MLQKTSRARIGRRSRRIFAATVAAIPLLGAAQWANAQISTWTFDGNGNWTTAANWNNGEPNSTSTSAVIDDGDTAVTVNLNVHRSVQNLTIGADDSLIFNDNTRLFLDGTFITNSGTIRLNTVGNITNLSIGGGGDVTLSGGGTVILTGNTSRLLGSNTLINQNNLITGEGQIGVNTIGFTNQAGGTVDASGGALIIDPSGLGVINAGTMQASAGGSLRLQGGTFNNTGGRIQALTGGEVQLLNGAFVSGGTLAAAGTGVIRTLASNTAAIADLTNTGTVNIVDNSTLQFSGTITNNNVFSMQSVGNNTHAIFNAPTTLTGAGSLQLGSTAANRVGGSSTLTNAAGHTIAGGGNLGIDTLTIVNQGLIDSNIGGTMIVDPGSANGLFNTGTMRASNGILQLSGNGGGTFDNSGGVIHALTGAEVQLVTGALITGGSLSTAGTGVIRSIAGDTVALNTLTNAGSFIISDNSTVQFSGTITNNNVFSMQSVGNITRAMFNTDTILTGPGSLQLGSNPNNRVGGSGTLTNAAGHTISGGGNVGSNTLTVVNNGLVDANLNNTSMVVDPGSANGFINQGTMQASNFARLQLTGSGGGTFFNTLGVIQALADSEVQLFTGALITGGSLNTVGNGVIRSIAGDTVALNALTNSGLVIINDNSTIQFSGTIINNNVFSMQSVGNPTYAIFNTDTILTGPGSLQLGSVFTNRLGGSGTLTNALGHTIAGGGNVGFNALTVVNNGLVDANIAATMTVDPGPTNGLTNNGIMRASSGGVLVLSGNGGGSFDNSAGTIQALNGSEVQLTVGAQVIGGTITTSGSGIFRANPNEIVGITNVTNLGNIVVSSNADLEVTGTITNNGSINVTSVGHTTNLGLRSNTTFAGTGIVTVSGSPNAGVNGVPAGSFTLTNGVGHTFQGLGQFGRGSISIVNQGLINANSSGNELTIDPHTSAGLSNHSGTLQASGGGVLLLTGNGGGSFNNSGGYIQALTGSEVQLTTGAQVIGGTITTSGTGVFRANGSQSVGISNLTNTGNVVVNDNADFEVSGIITNNGSINVVSAGSATDIELQVDTFFNGTGVITLANHPNSGINGIAGNFRLINLAGHTIQGLGRLGQNDIAITNQGLIDANAGAGQALTVDPANVANALVNNGTMQASSAGVLLLTGNLGGTFDNTGGVIQALTGSEVQMTNTAQIVGGIITTSGTGVFRANGSQNVGIANLTNTGNVVVNDNADFEVSGIITNNGSINVVSVGSATDIELQVDTFFSGTGVITLANHPDSGINGIAGNFRLTNLAGHTIQGLGRLGQNVIAITNQGLIDANAGVLTVDPAGVTNGLLNTGTMQASSAGVLLLTGNLGGTFDNTGGVIQALTGSEVQMTNTAQIVGGIITTSGTGVFRANGGQSVGISNLTNTGNVVVNDNADFEVSGIITNNGSINVVSAGSATDIELQVDTFFNGTGVITLANHPNSGINGIAGNFRLTNGVGHTIQGFGQLGQNVIAITNGGLVHANVAGQILTVDPVNVTDGFLNDTTGTVRSSTGATMNLSGNGGGAGTGQFTNNGIFEVLNGSTLQTTNSGVILNDVAGALTGGTWRSVAAANLNLMTFLNSPAVTTLAGGTTMEFSGAFARIQFGANVPVANSLTTNAGYLKIFDGHTFTMINALNNSGTVELGGLGLADGTLNSGGNIVNTGEIFGHGRLLDTVLNSGTVRATNGTLVVTGGVIDGQSGTIQIDPAATLDLSGAAGDSDTDFLIHNGAGLTLGTNNVLVRNDYTNANFGSGNSFNPRANVTGAGQILASPAVAQTLTGNVTGGGGATPSMDFGNLRVGSTSFKTYAVNNVGASGPALRGAIQTDNAAGNNGNLTDGRLSGAGVTAADFGPISNNSATGNQTVTFNATSAGALTGQQVAIVNNFDNVAEQLLTFTGAAYNPAVSNVTPGSISFGNFHVGDVVPSQAITIANTAPAGAFSEDLRATNIAPTGDGQLTGPSAVSVLGGSSTTTVGASMSTVSAGNKSGTIGMDLFTNATVNGVAIPGLSSLSLGTASVALNATVYRLATPFVITPLNLGDFHVGSIAQGSMVVSNTGAGDGFTENLFAQATAINGDLTSGTGSAAIGGGTNSAGALTAQLSTASAGPKTGNVTIAMTSLAGGVGLSNTGLGNSTVTVNANAYNLASLIINNPTINFGIVHVGDAVTPVGVSITNGAAAVPAGFSEKLNTIFGVTGPGILNNGGVINLLNPQANNAVNMTVGLNTATNQVIGGTVQILPTSDGAGVNTLGQTPRPAQLVDVSGQVNLYADPAFSKFSGDGVFSLTGPDQYLLDFGTVLTNAPISAELLLLNSVLNPADNLGGTWLDNSGVSYAISGFNAFNNLAPGNGISNLDIAFDTSVNGTFTGSIVLTPRSQNAGGYDQLLASGNVVINLTGTVEVPEPVMVLPMLAAGMLFRRRRRVG